MVNIGADKEKCVGCNVCIKVCPIPGANISKKHEDGKTIISIDNEKCISCGACVKACPHGARNFMDDCEKFFQDIKKEKINVIIAPAIKSVFKKDWNKIIAFLRKEGALGIYDVSFGADICTWAHLKYVGENPGKKLVSQPCPAIVNYALKHNHKLLENLSPIQSPMGCTAVYLRKVMGFKGKIAAISPCIAKRDEFKEFGVIDYNVTMTRLKEYLANKKVNLNDILSENSDFDGYKGFEGSIYPMPGGLKASLLYHAPNLRALNAEGSDKIYKELDRYTDLKDELKPDVYDVLNCENGCNGGSAIGCDYDSFSTNNVMYNLHNKALENRNNNKTKKGKDKQFQKFEKKLNLADYCLVYKPQDIIKKSISEKDIEKAFDELDKHTKEEREYNCGKCGYDSCMDMAKAMAKGEVDKGNCYQYVLKILEKDKGAAIELNKKVRESNVELLENFENLMKNIEVTKKEADNICEVSINSTNKMDKVADKISELPKLNTGVMQAVEKINTSIRNYNKMTESVQRIADRINLLSLNAAIEAAKAGEAGRGFSVVASNIRELSDNSKEAVGSAKNNKNDSKRSMDEINKLLEEFRISIEGLVLEIKESMEDFAKANKNSMHIEKSMTDINVIGSQVKEIIKKINIIVE